MLVTVEHDELDQALSGWLARHSQRPPAVALDGTTMRAALTGHADMPQTQVVAAMSSHGEILGPATVHGGNENAAARELLTRLGRQALTDTVITADAKHTGLEEIGAQAGFELGDARVGPRQLVSVALQLVPQPGAAEN